MASSQQQKKIHMLMRVSTLSPLLFLATATERPVKHVDEAVEKCEYTLWVETWGIWPSPPWVSKVNVTLLDKNGNDVVLIRNLKIVLGMNLFSVHRPCLESVPCKIILEADANPSAQYWSFRAIQVTVSTYNASCINQFFPVGQPITPQNSTYVVDLCNTSQGAREANAWSLPL